MSCYSAVVFDLDGTLLDTLADIAHSANRVLEYRGLPPYPVDAYRYFVGEGVAKLFTRALPEEQRDANMIDGCVQQFRDIYRKHWNVHTRPYDGIQELLDALADFGIKMAVLSNKPHEFTTRCVEEYLSGHDLQITLGQRDGIPPKPDPAGAREIVEELSIPPAKCVYLGDSAVDMQTAVAVGMYPVAALWGFRPRAELEQNGAQLLIDRPLELLMLFDGSQGNV